MLGLCDLCRGSLTVESGFGVVVTEFAVGRKLSKSGSDWTISPSSHG